ncbi:hypothetical protein ACFY5D_01075 [Paeniglutamicibacter sp. NPDC012692]|uniref:hypothetical protein n=1 Tax=Paeniglutamicibacter sp. NPDC012692 TaxID=3364388 RepID=UPI003694DD0B
MPTVIARHDVKDMEHWLASRKRAELFGPLGITNVRTFVDPLNPTQVAVEMDVPDMDAFLIALQTEAFEEAMAHDGVLRETLVLLVEV